MASDEVQGIKNQSTIGCVSFANNVPALLQGAYAPHGDRLQITHQRVFIRQAAYFSVMLYLLLKGIAILGKLSVQAHVTAAELFTHQEEIVGSDGMLRNKGVVHIDRMPVWIPTAQRIQSTDGHAMIFGHEFHVRYREAQSIYFFYFLRLYRQLAESSEHRRL